MTREEAIFILKRDNPNNIAVRLGFESLYDQREEAFLMAIKALEQQPCEDCINCISRKEMLKYQEYLHGKMSNEENHKLWEFIKQLPPVTPQPKIGHWIFTTEGSTDHITCSICGRDSMSNFDYCPNCGAKMIESEE